MHLSSGRFLCVTFTRLSWRGERVMSPPWPLWSLIYRSMLVSLVHDYPWGHKETASQLTITFGIQNIQNTNILHFTASKSRLSTHLIISRRLQFTNDQREDDQSEAADTASAYCVELVKSFWIQLVFVEIGRASCRERV